MNILVSVDKNWAIGIGDKKLVSIPNDNNLLREETRGKVVIVGRKTYESLQNSLYDRKVIVLSKNNNYKLKDKTVVHSVSECMDYISKNNINNNDVFVLGGESIYKEFLPYVDTVHVTFIDFEYHADKFFENLDISNAWKKIIETEEETYFDLAYYFRMYKKI